MPISESAQKPRHSSLTDGKGVLIVESPGANELTRKIGEAVLVSELLRLSEVPHYSIEARCENELDLAANLFRRGQFATVIFSAHGCPDGISLSDGLPVHWEQLFWKFGFSRQHKVILSACSCFDQEQLVKAHLEMGPERAPGVTFGYKTSVSWKDSAIASMLLARAIHQDSESHLRALYGIELALGLDVCGVIFSHSMGGYCTFSGRDFLQGTLKDYRDGNCDSLVPPLPEEEGF